ncbi:glycosyltransferase [Croceicoccus sp. F390]|uniref:Glycosyltransferase n=1 Tax=Croceicoccus esteveae TaxID=3075597 RepID=A0ABU2ZGR6_9SPHN|nr:glycosyltransferase [Croceicoccus sp. F390]MDT0575786.1 glycosyltransferase [Croceicoccus sp. F390]
MKTNQAVRVGFRVGKYPEISETFIDAQIADMASRGFAVSLLGDTVAPGTGSGVAVYQTLPRGRVAQKIWPMLPWRMRQAWIAATERRWAARNDVIVCNFGWFGAQFERFTRAGQRPPFVTIFHGADLSRNLRDEGERIYDDLLANCDLLLTVSDLYRRRLLELGAPAEKIAVQRMGVDLSQLAFTPRSPDRPVSRILHVGRLVEKKGTEFLLRAFAATRSDPGMSAITLDIVGTGPLRSGLEQLAATLAITDRVNFAGALPHDTVRAMLEKTDLFILPSVTAADGDMEGVPVALMEAMASGIPVISTRHSGIPELVEHEVTGLLADERDVEQLAAQIRRMVADATLRNRLVHAARERVEQQFNRKRLHDALADMLRTLARR